MTECKCCFKDCVGKDLELLEFNGDLLCKDCIGFAKYTVKRILEERE